MYKRQESLRAYITNQEGICYHVEVILSSKHHKGLRYKRPIKKAVVTISKKPLLKSAYIATKPKTAVVERPKPKKLLPPLEKPKPGSDGSLELDALMSEVLEDELQKIMIKIWQVLPDNAPTDDEKSVVEKFRNEASDDLRNALGLSVTQRLLNTFNPLNVKVHFSTKPERKFLRHFLKKYNFVAFKRIVRVNNTFAAQVKTIQDYDDLCSNKNIYCGAAKITISPCYRFMQCPKNLKTIYGIPEEENPTEDKKSSDQGNKMDVDDTDPEETKTENKESQDKTVSNTTNEKTKESDEKKVENTNTSVKESNIKPETTNKTNQVVKTTPKHVDTKPIVNKTVVKTENTTMTAAKPVANKSQNAPVTNNTSKNQIQNTTATKKVEIPKDKATGDNKPATSNTTPKTNTQPTQLTATKTVEAAKDKVTDASKTTTSNTNTKTNIQTSTTKKVEVAKENVTENVKTITSNTNTKANVQATATKKLETTKGNVTVANKTTIANTNTKTNVQATAAKKVETISVANKTATSNANTNVQTTAAKKLETTKDVSVEYKTTANTKANSQTASKPAVEADKTKTAVKPEAATANTISTPKPTETKNINTTAAKASTQKPTEIKNINTGAAKVSTQKPTETKNTNVVAAQTVETKTLANANASVKTKPNVVATKAVVKTPTAKETAVNTKPAVKTPNAANIKKVTPVKTNATPAKPQPTKSVTNRTPDKENVKNVAAKVVKKTDFKKPSKGDDYEELDDQELYQYLMSAGIVLDECSGSEDE